MNYNIDGIKTSASNIKASQTSLKSAMNTIYGIKTPSDFIYASKLKGLSSQISIITSNLGSIYTWMNTSISNLKRTEKANQQVVNLLNSSLSISTLGKNKKESYLNFNLYGNTDAKNKQNINYEWGSNYFDNLFQTAPTAKKNGNTKKSLLNMTIPETLAALTKSKVGTSVKSSIKNLPKTIGNAIKVAGNGIYSMVTNPDKTAASVSNIGIIFSKGAAKVGEQMFDAALIVGQGQTEAQLIKNAYDPFLTQLGLNAVNKEDVDSIISEMRKSTMAKVAVEHVENAFKKFYENTKVGKAIEKLAFAPFKSGGVVANFASGMGEVAGRASFDLIMPGGSTVAAFFSGMGKSAEESLVSEKMASWEGIKDLYKEGSISKEEYNKLKKIRNMDDKTWNLAKKEYRSGNISKEEFKYMESIRNLKEEDWKTDKNYANATLSSITNGTWEAVQWYAGGKLNNWEGLSSKKITSAIRVGTDTLFNSLDTPFRALTKTLVSDDKNVGKAFNELGGVKSVIRDGLIGFVGSVVGELLNYRAERKKVKEQSSEKMDMGVINQSYGSNIENVSEIQIGANGGLVEKKHLDIVKEKQYSQLDEKMTLMKEKIGFYGKDQDITHSLFYFEAPNGEKVKLDSAEYLNYRKQGIDLNIKYKPEYYEIQKHLKTKYNMSNVDIQKTLSMANAGKDGLCTYAATLNTFQQVFGDNSEKYYKATGLKLDDGIIGDAKDMTDLFIFCNSKERGGNIFQTVEGKTSVISDSIKIDEHGMTTMTKDQHKFVGAWQRNDGLYQASFYDTDMVNDFLKNNGGKGYLSNNKVDLKGGNQKEYKKIMKQIQDSLEDGKSVIMNIPGKVYDVEHEYSGRPLVLVNLADNKVIGTGNHTVTVTGITEQGVLISTWAKRELVPHKALFNSKVFFDIVSGGVL